jgi:calcineurin-like phosphoesterase
VWKASGEAIVTFTVSSNSLKVVDLMGRVKTNMVTGSRFSLTIDTTPQYVQGKF